jgi:alanine racemase
MENFSIHLEIDTGMHRLGFAPKELPAVLTCLAENKKYIKVAFIFSHLASADDATLDKHTKKQITLFENCAKQASEILAYPIQKHLLNSAGIQRFPNATYNMVRLGIGLYGIASEPAQKEELKEVISFKTRIVHIQQLGKGETIGYNRRTVLQKDSKVATIPVGYADGFSRSLGEGKGEVWINDKACAVLGSVCMDFTMIDISEVDTHLDDVVLLFGQGFSAEKMADKRSTIPYEIFTSIAGRVARIFTRE